jgi:hypothetical protein
MPSKKCALHGVTHAESKFTHSRVLEEVPLFVEAPLLPPDERIDDEPYILLNIYHDVDPPEPGQPATPQDGGVGPQPDLRCFRIGSHFVYKMLAGVSEQFRASNGKFLACNSYQASITWMGARLDCIRLSRTADTGPRHVYYLIKLQICNCNIVAAGSNSPVGDDRQTWDLKALTVALSLLAVIHQNTQPASATEALRSLANPCNLSQDADSGTTERVST